MHWPHFLLLASDATRYLMAGGALLALSLLAMWGERRRAGRKHIDAVGIMPWRDIAALSSFAGLALLAFGTIGWLKG
jgi:hypothetical protein